MKFPQEKGVQKGVQCNLHILSKAYIKTLHNKLETLTPPPPPPPFGVLILIWWLNTYVIFYLLNGNNFSFLSDYVFLNKKHIMFPNKTSTPRSVFHNYIVYTKSFEKLCVNFFSSFLQKMAKSKCIQKVLYNTC